MADVNKCTVFTCQKTIFKNINIYYMLAVVYNAKSTAFLLFFILLQCMPMIV